MEASEAVSCRCLKVAVTLGRSHSSLRDDAEGDGSGSSRPSLQASKASSWV